jgi:hypothetical protein
MQIDFQRFEQIPRTLLGLVLLTVLLLPLVLIGAETDPPVDDKLPVTGIPQVGLKTPQSVIIGAAKSALQTPPSSTPTPKPVKQFKPTDKIGADSAVSFPVDI